MKKWIISGLLSVVATLGTGAALNTASAMGPVAKPTVQPVNKAQSMITTYGVGGIVTIICDYDAITRKGKLSLNTSKESYNVCFVVNKDVEFNVVNFLVDVEEAYHQVDFNLQTYFNKIPYVQLVLAPAVEQLEDSAETTDLTKPISQLDDAAKKEAQGFILGLLGNNEKAKEICDELFTAPSWAGWTLQDVGQYFVKCYNESLWFLNHERQIERLRQMFQLPANLQFPPDKEWVINWVREHMKQTLTKPINELEDVKLKEAAKNSILQLLGNNEKAKDICEELFTKSDWAGWTLQDVGQYFVKCYNESLWFLNHERQIERLRQMFQLPANLQFPPDKEWVINWVREHMKQTLTNPINKLEDVKLKEAAKNSILQLLGNKAEAHAVCEEIFTDQRWAGWTLQDVGQYFVVCFHEGLWNLSNGNGEIEALRKTFNLQSTNFAPTPNTADAIKWVRENRGPSYWGRLIPVGQGNRCVNSLLLNVQRVLDNANRLMDYMSEFTYFKY